LKTLIVPQKTTESYHRYYDIHFQYIFDLFSDQGYKLQFREPIVKKMVVFDVNFKGHEILIDFYDYSDLPDEGLVNRYEATFKFHTTKHIMEKFNNIFPISPISFYDWNEYRTLLSTIKYKAHGRIYNKQTPHTQNYYRRFAMKQLLLSNYPESELDLGISPRSDFFQAIKDCLVSVCVPGSHNNILDRGQLQYMALGVCTISPQLTAAYVPWNEQFEAGTHYLKCADDYSDVIKLIEWVREHPKESIQIGQNAKELFQRTCLPEKQINWMLFCLKELF